MPTPKRGTKNCGVPCSMAVATTNRRSGRCGLANVGLWVHLWVQLVVSQDSWTCLLPAVSPQSSLKPLTFEESSKQLPPAAGLSRLVAVGGRRHASRGVLNRCDGETWQLASVFVRFNGVTLSISKTLSWDGILQLWLQIWHQLVSELKLTPISRSETDKLRHHYFWCSNNQPMLCVCDFGVNWSHEWSTTQQPSIEHIQSSHADFLQERAPYSIGCR